MCRMIPCRALGALLSAVVHVNSQIDGEEFVSPIGYQEISVSSVIEINSISDIESRAMQFSIDATLDNSWTLETLTAAKTLEVMQSHSVVDSLNPGETVKVPSNKMYLFWMPDPYFPQARTVQMPSEDTPTQTLYISGTTPPTMRFILRQKIIVNCPMYFFNFPVDHHECRLTMRSFAYAKNQVNLSKKPNVDQVVYKGSPVLSENYVHVESCSASNNGSVEKLHEFCVLFKFQRKLFYQLCSTCIPVFLLVIASFCPFYMSIKSTSSRVNVCVIVFQAMIGIVMQTRTIFIPPVPYFTLMDLYTLTCASFVVLSIAETVVVRVLLSKEDAHDIKQKIQKHNKRRKTNETVDDVHRRSNQLMFDFQRGNQKRQAIDRAQPEPRDGERKFPRNIFRNITDRINLTATTFDRTSGRIFQLSFLVFNIVFWLRVITIAP